MTLRKPSTKPKKNTPKINVGIDPGANGAIAIRRQKGMRVNWNVVPLPMTEGKPWKKGTRVDDDAVRKIFNQALSCQTTDRIEIAIERQYAQGKQGVTSGGTTMFNYGVLVTVAKEWAEPVCVNAKTWQDVMLDAGEGNTKERSITTCQRRFPNINLLRTSRCKVPSDGFSDAVLIAEYCATYKEMKGKTK